MPDQTALQIRAMTPSDFDAVYQTVKLTGTLDRQLPYTYWALMTAAPRLAHVATVDDKVVGLVVGLRGFATETTAFLWQIGVAPHAQRQGLGMSLLSRFVDEAKALGCCYVMTSISATNAPSNALFERFCKSNAYDMAAVGETGTLGGAMENEVLFSITL